MQIARLLVLLVFCLAFLAGCESTGSSSAEPQGQPLGNSGVHVSGTIESGMTQAVR
jgi:hypothetical protein